ncbi:MAG: hypothetical protein GAK30_03202 [Paracidovorax wautersii]|uniref:Regulator RcnB of Ni and Co efflux n=1 Tax=Paracidovorax wautersii TaxID=1177982 RepID=A0A7V8FLJ8_9BURK|nr:MAG: hypothetical protein GAK30_03202 [Paracidovorax wautersii]
MKKILASAMAAALLTGSLGAFAQPGPGPDNRRGGPDMQQQQQQQWPGRGPDVRPGMRDGPPGYAPGADRRAGPDGPRFNRGDRLPDTYRGHQYVVDDWRGHGLRPPPRGHRWVQVGGEYVLVAIATGVIASIILNGQ